MDPPSQAGIFGANENSSCGYCRQGASSQSHGMMTPVLAIDDYQRLIDRGWRRSGTYCYKPVMNKTCCPSYTIKCDLLNYSFTKSQKKNLKKFNKYIIDGLEPEKHTEDDVPDNHPNPGTSFDRPGPSQEPSAKKPNLNVAKGVGQDPNKGPCKKAKQLRLEKREQKLKAKGIDPATVAKKVPQTQEKTLEDIINELPAETKKKLTIKLVKSSNKSSEYKAAEAKTYNLYVKYQASIHDDPPSKCTLRQFDRFLVNSPLQIKFVKFSDDDFKRTFKLSAQLFQKYNSTIHNDSLDECDESVYKEYFVDTPLSYETIGDMEFGSYHQQYWIDDDLIAVGVLDILPKCVSSVYFFYDPDLPNLSLGTFGALREIAFSRQLNRKFPEIKYYYMGYYINSCVKMRYKGNFQPSYLLCPETYEWISYKDAIAAIDEKPYSRLNPDVNATEPDVFTDSDLNTLLMYDGRSGKMMKYGDYKRMIAFRINAFSDVDERALKIYGSLVGKYLSEKIIFIV